jgi:acetyltransferase-like isoleucine patch superfamily enzyme
MRRPGLMLAAWRACRLMLNSSIPLRHLRNWSRFPGLAMAPSVNHAITGTFKYGNACEIDEGCNLIVAQGAMLRLGEGCRLGRYVELGPSGAIEIGDRTSIQDRSILIGDVAVGRYCVLSLNVLMTSGTHYFDRWPEILIRDQDARIAREPDLAAKHSRPIWIGEDCWLGMNSVVMPGVTVGRGCVIGANAVVTRNLPPYSIAVGVPARIVRQRLAFRPPRRISWAVQEHLPYFYSGFRLADAEREIDRVHGGYVPDNRFALWLDHTSCEELKIVARAIDGVEVAIDFGDARAYVGSTWTECGFPLVPRDGPIWLNTAGDARIAIREAWVL